MYKISIYPYIYFFINKQKGKFTSFNDFLWSQIWFNYTFLSKLKWLTSAISFDNSDLFSIISLINKFNLSFFFPLSKLVSYLQWLSPDGTILYKNLKPLFLFFSISLITFSTLGSLISLTKVIGYDDSPIFILNDKNLSIFLFFLLYPSSWSTSWNYILFYWFEWIGETLNPQWQVQSHWRKRTAEIILLLLYSTRKKGLEFIRANGNIFWS